MGDRPNLYRLMSAYFQPYAALDQQLLHRTGSPNEETGEQDQGRVFHPNRRTDVLER